MSNYKVPPANKVYPQAIKKSLGVFLAAAIPIFILCADYSSESLDSLLFGSIFFLVSIILIMQPFFASYKYINIIRYSIDDKEPEPESIAHFEKLISIFYKSAIVGLLLPLTVLSFFTNISPYAVYYPFGFAFVFLPILFVVVSSEIERYGSSHFFYLVENITGKNLFGKSLT